MDGRVWQTLGSGHASPRTDGQRVEEEERDWGGAGSGTVLLSSRTGFPVRNIFSTKMEPMVAAGNFRFVFASDREMGGCHEDNDVVQIASDNGLNTWQRGFFFATLEKTAQAKLVIFQSANLCFIT